MYDYRIDHDLRKIELTETDSDLLSVLMATCPANVEYALYIGSELIGWASFAGTVTVKIFQPIETIKMAVTLTL